jgi:orotate phosphoribosyltransferase
MTDDRLSRERIEELFISSGAVLKGHFKLTSGRHSAVYWEKFRVIENPAAAVPLCGLIAEHFAGKGVELVVGPTTGGIILAFETARQMGLPAAFAEKLETGERAFRRGFRIPAGRRVLVVDDVLTTGKSIREVLDALAGYQAEVVGIGVLVDRSGGGLDFDGLLLYGCLEALAPSYSPEDCPLCRQGEPLTKPGSS